MATIKQEEYEGLLRRVAEKHGAAKAQALKAVLSDPDFQDELLLLSQGPSRECLRASLELHGVLAGKVDRARLVTALRGTLFGVHEQLALRAIAQEEAPSRPAEQRLVEALRGLCRAKRQQAVKMANADFDLAWLEAETATIEDLRAVAQLAVRFTSTVVRNLAVHEDAACRTMRQAYGKVREAARADDALWEHLEATESYLFGPAQQAAVTRARMDEVRREAFSAGEQQALRTAERNVRHSLADEILTLSEDLRRTVERDLDDRGRSR